MVLWAALGSRHDNHFSGCFLHFSAVRTAIRSGLFRFKPRNTWSRTLEWMQLSTCFVAVWGGGMWVLHYRGEAHCISRLFRRPPSAICQIIKYSCVVDGGNLLVFTIWLPSLSSGFCHILKLSLHVFKTCQNMRSNKNACSSTALWSTSVCSLSLCLLQHRVVHRLPGNAWKRCSLSQSVAFSDEHKNRGGCKFDILMGSLICLEKDFKFWYISWTSNMLPKSVYRLCLW